MHQLHGAAIEAAEAPAKLRPPAPSTVAGHTFTSCNIVFPEVWPSSLCSAPLTGSLASNLVCGKNRNVHGKTFGGFVVGHSFNLAYYAAQLFTRGKTIVPLGLDEAVFLQPIAIGDLVNFTARVVHATNNTCRVGRLETTFLGPWANNSPLTCSLVPSGRSLSPRNYRTPPIPTASPRVATDSCLSSPRLRVLEANPSLR